MFRRFLPLVAVSLWVFSGHAEEIFGYTEEFAAKTMESQDSDTEEAVSIEVVTPDDCKDPCVRPKECKKPRKKIRSCKKPCAKPRPRPCKPKKEKDCAPVPPPCSWEFNPCNPKGCSDMDCGGFYVTADFLYWKAENHGFSYAYQLKNSDPSNENVGKVARVSPEWDIGFRAGLGWNSTHDYWDFLANYTWYRNEATETRVSNANGFIQMTPLSDATVGLFSTVTAGTHFLMNMGDLEAGRMIYLSKTIAIRPHLGLRGGSLNQKFKDHFTGAMNAGLDSDAVFKGKNNYWGAGPRTGVNGEWHMSDDFSLIGKLSGSLLYGQTKATSVEKSKLVGGTDFSLDRKTADHFDQLVPNLQLAIGLQWGTCFWSEQMFFKMSASWEANYWWNQFNLPMGVDGYIAPFPTVGNQPLTMEGVTINFELDF